MNTNMIRLKDAIRQMEVLLEEMGGAESTIYLEKREGEKYTVCYDFRVVL